LNKARAVQGEEPMINFRRGVVGEGEAPPQDGYASLFVYSFISELGM